MFSNYKLPIISLALFASVYLISCASSPITYRYDRDKEAPIQDYTTFKVVRPSEELIAQMEMKHPENIPLLEEAIIEQMEKRSYTQADDAELIITYYVSGKDFQKAQSSTVTVGVGFGGYHGGVGVSQGKTNIKYFDYREGTLVIDFYNKNEELIWHGIASGSYEVEKTDVQALTKTVVKKIFQYYRYKVKVPKEKKP
jgi:Domain of unknown function (DUF4136)